MVALGEGRTGETYADHFEFSVDVRFFKKIEQGGS